MASQKKAAPKAPSAKAKLTKKSVTRKESAPKAIKPVSKISSLNTKKNSASKKAERPKPSTSIQKTSPKSSFPWLKKYPKNIPWDVKIPAAPIYALLDETALKFPNAYCVDFLGKKYTYAQILDLTNRAAKGLQKSGVKKGTKVGLFMPNAFYYPVMYYAILKAGGVVVNYSPLYAEREIKAIIEDSDTDIIVTLDLEALYPKIYHQLHETRLKQIIVCPLAETLPFPKNFLFPIIKRREVAKVRQDPYHIHFRDLIQNDGKFKPVEINPEKDLAVLQYTGGTTGSPKGAMLSHANVYGNAAQARMWFTDVEEGKEKILAALPLFHVFAMTAVMNLAVKIGAEMVMMFPRFNVDEAMKMIEKHKITFFPAVPTIYTMINGHPKASTTDMSSLKACLSGGASLPLEVRKAFENLTGCKLVEAYGLSETSPAVTSNPLFGENKSSSIGIPFPATEVKIMSLDGSSKPVKPGEKGEIAVKGPQVMLGYWKKPAETKAVMAGDFFLTGDVGYMDEDGYVFLVDRIKDVIICSGFNVYPRNVEEAIYLHPAVEEVTVIGIPDKKRGETVKAFVKLRGGATLTEEELLAFLEDKLSPIETPKLIEFREALPKTMIGKLSKKELVEEERQKIKKK